MKVNRYVTVNVNKATLSEQKQQSESDRETILMDWCNWASIKKLLMNKLLQRRQYYDEEKNYGN